jgi:hypothetical protein
MNEKQIFESLNKDDWVKIIIAVTKYQDFVSEESKNGRISDGLRDAWLETGREYKELMSKLVPEPEVKEVL